MAIAFAMVFFGSMLVLAGWKNVAVSGLARGDATKPKPTIIGATQ